MSARDDDARGMTPLTAPPAACPQALPEPCAAWSLHAADLARDLAPRIQPWPADPATQALVLDGVLLRLREDLHVPAVDCASSVDRAVAVGCALGPALRGHHVIGGATAAWVLLGGSPPDPLELVSPSHRAVLAGVAFLHGELAPGDVELLGGAPITVPGRTALDLLRRRPAHVALPLVAALLRSGHLDAREVQRRLGRLQGTPHTRRAQELLERAGAQAESEARESTGLPSAVTR